MSHTEQPSAQPVRARAHANIALIKYWGKRDPRLNLPATGSISITLEALSTDTWVRFDESLDSDQVKLNERSDPEAEARIGRFLDVIRDLAGDNRRAQVESRNNFPTGAGLASSASGFAALALAASRAAGLDCDPAQLSMLARQGSGSAARSIFGGFVEMRRGDKDDGSDAYAAPLAAAADWPLEVVVAITHNGEKQTGSTAGMQASAQTSPFYPAWLEGADADLAAMREAIAGHDFQTLGELAEHNCLKMHALMLSSRPGLVYWQPGTVAAMHAVRGLRADGVPVYFTIDAGPQVKAICPPEQAKTVAERLEQVAGVTAVIRSRLGPGAQLLDTDACT